jgi:hypothetical protein
MFKGRGPYEDEVIQTVGERSDNGQQYNDHGHPRNPETRRREREHVRAANEVMQVTGVVEDSHALKQNASYQKTRKVEDTFTGLRLMEIGRAVLVGGVWGVLGLRRRILVMISFSAFDFTKKPPDIQAIRRSKPLEYPKAGEYVQICAKHVLVRRPNGCFISHL